MASDWQLLDQYIAEGDQPAFARIVGRNIDLVYAAARRLLGQQVSYAEDVTQGVFLLLAQKAGTIPRRGALAAWLHQATRYCCAEVRRKEGRRRRHEWETIMNRPAFSASPTMPDDSDDLKGFLDEALAQLGQVERSAILVRYLQGKTIAETAGVLGVSVDAVDKRLKRGVENLRNIFAGRGLVVPAAGVAAVMMAESVKAAPMGLGASVASAAAVPASASAAVISIAKGASAMMKLAMLKVAAVILCLVAIPVAVGVAIRAAQGDAPSAATAASTVPAKLPFTLGKETTIITGPLREDGTPDYVKALNDKYSKGVTPENNAYVAWLKFAGTENQNVSPKKKDRILAMAGTQPSAGIMKWPNFVDFLKARGVNDAALSKTFDDDTTALYQLWTAADHPELAAYLEENGKYLDGVKEAFARERYWMPFVASDGRTMNHLGFGDTASLLKMNGAARALSVRATFRAKADDFDGFLSDVLAAERIARHLGSAGMLVERMNGTNIESHFGSRVVGTVAGRGILTAKQCAALARAFDELGPPPPGITEAVDVEERWNILDCAATMAIGKGHVLEVRENNTGVVFGIGPGVDLLARVEKDSVDWNAVLKALNAEVDEIVKGLREPTMEKAEAAWERSSESWQLHDENAGIMQGLEKLPDETKQAYSQRVEDVLLGKILGLFNSAARGDRECAMRDQMARALVAAAWYRADKGKWPERLSVLVPEYLKEVPKDLYSPGGMEAVRYVVGKDGARVYSIGRNRVDDGGVRDMDTQRDDIVVGVPAE